MPTFANPKNSIALCDVCDFQFKWTELRLQIVNRKKTGLLVCNTCWDIDNPQLQVGRFPQPEAIAIANPRSDSKERAASRGFANWNPVQGLAAQVTMGVVVAS